MTVLSTQLEEHLIAAIECADDGDFAGAARHLRDASALDPRESFETAIAQIEALDSGSDFVDLRAVLADDLVEFPAAAEAGSALGALDDDFFGAELVIEAPVSADEPQYEIPELDDDDLTAVEEPSERDERPRRLTGDFEIEDFDELDGLIDTEALDRHTGDQPVAVADGDEVTADVDAVGSHMYEPPPAERVEQRGVLDEPVTKPDADELAAIADFEFPDPSENAFANLFDDDEDPAAGATSATHTDGFSGHQDPFGVDHSHAVDDDDASAGHAPGRALDVDDDEPRQAHARGARYHAAAPPPPTHRRRTTTGHGIEAAQQAPQPSFDESEEDDDDAWDIGFSNPGSNSHVDVDIEPVDASAFARATSSMQPPSERRAPDERPDGATTVETDAVSDALPPPRRKRSGQHRGTSLSTRPVPLVDDDAVYPNDAASMSSAASTEPVATAPGMPAFDNPDLALARARALRDRGDIASALRIIDGLLEAAPTDHRAHALRKSLVKQLAALRMSQLEPLSRIAQLAGRPSGLTPRSMFLLTFVDGMSSLQDIIDLSGLAPGEAGELLLELLESGAIRVR